MKYPVGKNPNSRNGFKVGYKPTQGIVENWKKC